MGEVPRGMPIALPEKFGRLPIPGISSVDLSRTPAGVEDYFRAFRVTD